MFQQVKLLIRLVGLFLSRRQGMALLERVEASTLRAEDRDLVTHIIRVMLRLPDDPVQEPSLPEAGLPACPIPTGKAKRQRQSPNASSRRQRPWS